MFKSDAICDLHMLNEPKIYISEMLIPAHSLKWHSFSPSLKIKFHKMSRLVSLRTASQFQEALFRF